MMSLTERLALSAQGLPQEQRTFSSWQQVVDYARRNTPRFRSSGVERYPSDFLTIHPVSLTDRNKQSLPRFQAAICRVLDHYLRPDGALSAFASLSIRRQEPVATFLKDSIEIWKTLNAGNGILQILETAQPDIFPDQIIENVDRHLFKDMRRASHPLFQSLTLFDPLLIKSEFLTTSGYSDSPNYAGANSGLFAVVREARGWSAVEEKEVNVIVRDLLWIEDPSASTKDVDAAAFHGLYISAYDEECYRLKEPLLQSDNIVVSGTTESTETASHWMTLLFPATFHSHPLQIRDGILTGFAGRRLNLGAWKLLLIRPDWEFHRQLATILAQATLGNIGNILAASRDSHAIGVIHSEHLIAGDAELSKRRDIFRRLISIDADVPNYAKGLFEDVLGDPIRTEVTNQMVQQILELVRQDELDKIGPVIRGIMDAAAAKLMETTSTVIEPAQIITFRHRTVTRTIDSIAEHDQNDIAKLLDTELVERGYFAE